MPEASDPIPAFEELYEIPQSCVIPLIPMFWVISTAFVLHGVIISFLGPIKVPLILSFSTGWHYQIAR